MLLCHPLAALCQAGPLPKAKRVRNEPDDDERSSWTHSISHAKSQGSGEEERLVSNRRG